LPPRPHRLELTVMTHKPLSQRATRSRGHDAAHSFSTPAPSTSCGRPNYVRHPERGRRRFPPFREATMRSRPNRPPQSQRR
jgi:hypothetical protein